jgi:hypothetical protein
MFHKTVIWMVFLWLTVCIDTSYGSHRCFNDIVGGTVFTCAYGDPGRTFIKWGGACTGTATNCSLRITKNENIIINYRPMKPMWRR